MKQWLKVKLSEWTSRKFIGFILTEAAVVYLATGGYLTDSWAVIAGIIAPFVLYEFVNGALRLQSLKINLPQVQLNGETTDAIGEDIQHDNAAMPDPDGDDVVEVPTKHIEEMGFKK